MTFATHPRVQRISAVGAAALGAVFVVGAVVQLPQTQDDLATRVESKLAAAGIVVRAEFSGQDGTLHCTRALADPTQALALAQKVWGVRSIDVDVSCGVPGARATATTAPPSTPTSTPAPTPTTASTVPASTTGEAANSVPPTTSPSTTVPATTLPPAAPDQFTLALKDGVFTLGGTVASDLERFVLVDRANAALSPSNVVNNLTITDQADAVPATQFTGLLDVMALMPANLASGALGWNGSEGTLAGSYVSDDGRDALEAAAAESGVVASLTPRATATAEQAASLEAELNALVAAQPILFDKGSVDISLSSLGTVQQVAGIAKRFAGLSIEVQGHTDSEGDPGRNLTLSEQRAAAVRDTLIALGVPSGDITSKGFGVTQLILDSNGNELPDKSRRVVFGVSSI